jgi:transcriptional regulator with XRE-family HTH domain
MNAPTPYDHMQHPPAERTDPQHDPNDPDGKLLRLQKRFLRAFAWMRRAAGMTQREVAQATNWKQPYVARLEDERSPLIMALARVERYAQACGATGVLMFVDQQSGEVRRALALGDDGERILRSAAKRQRVADASAFSSVTVDDPYPSVTVSVEGAMFSFDDDVFDTEDDPGLAQQRRLSHT